jgi:hypothetical protein
LACACCWHAHAFYSDCITYESFDWHM